MNGLLILSLVVSSVFSLEELWGYRKEMEMFCDFCNHPVEVSLALWDCLPQHCTDSLTSEWVGFISLSLGEERTGLKSKDLSTEISWFSINCT